MLLCDSGATATQVQPAAYLAMAAAAQALVPQWLPAARQVGGQASS
jgi:hypothetical protein